jgi:hypothetical protein
VFGASDSGEVHPFGTPVVSAFGNTIGVYLSGNTGDETESFWATLGGSIFGMGVGIAGDIWLWNVGDESGIFGSLVG